MLTADERDVLAKRIFDLLDGAGADEHDNAEVFRVVHGLRYFADQAKAHQRELERINAAMSGVNAP